VFPYYCSTILRKSFHECALTSTGLHLDGVRDLDLAISFGGRPSGVLRYSPAVYNEHAVIAAFVNRNKRDRYREVLSNPRLRRKFTNQLAHVADFDLKYRLAIPSNKLFVNNIALELKKRYSPTPLIPWNRHFQCLHLKII
jgi:hypothetical protein